MYKAAFSNVPSRRTTVLTLATLAVMAKVKAYLMRERDFERKVQLVFPQYRLGGTEPEDARRKVSIVSENQLEHVIKLCNQHRMAVRSENDHNISAFKGINILIDYSQFDQIKKINVSTQKCKLEPGATFTALNRALALQGFYVPFVVPQLNEDSDTI